MKFDIVIGNPPYNRGMDLDFIDLGFNWSSKYVIMITPAKWQTAEDTQSVVSDKINYKLFREKIVPHMSDVTFYPNCRDVFDVWQIDGITHFLINKNSVFEEANIVNICSDTPIFNSRQCRSLSNGSTLFNIGNDIVTSLGKYDTFKFPVIHGGCRYEVWMNTKLGGYDWFSGNIDKYVLGIYRLLDKTRGDTYGGEAKCVFESDMIEECKSFVSWIYSKFTRFFVFINVSKLNNVQTDHYFRFVPAPPNNRFDHIFSDEELYSYFGLSNEYIDIIDKLIKKRY